jgi:hypothetical protein
MIDDCPLARVKGAQLVSYFPQVEELKKEPTYGVVVTDETIEVVSQPHADVTMTVLIIIYVRTDQDVRARLDAAIEDVWECLRSGQRVNAVVPYLQLESIQTDEGTTIVKPNAQAIMRWNCRVRRSVSW